MTHECGGACPLCVVQAQIAALHAEVQLMGDPWMIAHQEKVSLEAMLDTELTSEDVVGNPVYTAHNAPWSGVSSTYAGATPEPDESSLGPTLAQKWDELTSNGVLHFTPAATYKQHTSIHATGKAANVAPANAMEAVWKHLTDMPGCPCDACQDNQDPPGSQGNDMQDPPGRQRPGQLLPIRTFDEPWFTSYDDLREVATLMLWDRYPVPLLHVDEERGVVVLAALRLGVSQWTEALNRVTRRGRWTPYGPKANRHVACLLVEDPDTAVEQSCGRCGGHGTILTPNPVEPVMDEWFEEGAGTPVEPSMEVTAKTCTRCDGRGREVIDTPTVEYSVALGTINPIWASGKHPPTTEQLQALHSGALVGFGDDGTYAGQVMRSWPGLALYCAPCPATPFSGSSNCPTGRLERKRIFDVVIHLNDHHKWTREDIAAWLDSLEREQGIDLGPFRWTPEHKRGGSA